MTQAKTTGILALAILLFDSVAANIARTGAFSYGSLYWASFLLYGVTGLIVGKKFGTFGGAVSGLAVAFIDATLGWWMSAVLGPGAIPPGTSITEIVMTIAMVTVTGFLCGLLGGFIGGVFSPSR